MQMGGVGTQDNINFGEPGFWAQLWARKSIPAREDGGSTHKVEVNLSRRGENKPGISAGGIQSALHTEGGGNNQHREQAENLV